MSQSPQTLGFYAALVYRQTGSFLRGLRFWVRSHLRKEITERWLCFIEASPVLSQTPERVRGVLVDKIHRPFARCAFGPSERVDLLIKHYEVAARLFPAGTLATLVLGERMELAKLEEEKTDTSYVFTFCREMLSQHQGELTFLMTDEGSGIPLSRLVVNLTTDEQNRRTLLLNGLQGPGAMYKSQIVRVTRNLSGLRPKRAILEIVYAFAVWAKAERIVAIAKANHVSQTKEKWRRKIHADYDDFWQEFGATPLPNGDFEMPLSLPRREESDVAPKKRKVWLKRQELLASIYQQTAQALAALPKVSEDSPAATSSSL